MQDAAVASAVTSPKRFVERKRVLIVDDNVTLASILRRFLNRRGYSVSVAGTLHSARELCRMMIPSVVISDYNLPDGNGLTLLDELRAAGFCGKILLMTAYDTEWLASEAICRGASAFLCKPVPLDTLATLIGA